MVNVFLPNTPLIADNGVWGTLSSPRPVSCSTVSFYARRQFTRLATADASLTRVNDMRPFKIEGSRSGLYVAFTVYQVYRIPSTKRLLRHVQLLTRTPGGSIGVSHVRVDGSSGVRMPVKYIFLSCSCSVAEIARGRKAKTPMKVGELRDR